MVTDGPRSAVTKDVPSKVANLGQTEVEGAPAVTPRAALACSLVLVLAAAGCTPGPPNASPEPSDVAPSGLPAGSTSPTSPVPVVANAPVRVRVPFEKTSDQAPEDSHVVVVGDDIWIERHAHGLELLRFDAKNARVTTTVPLEYAVGLIAAENQSLWAVGPYGYAPGPSKYTVSRINLATAKLHEVTDVPIGGVWVGLGSIWTVTERGLRQLDRVTGETLARWDIRGDAVQVACGAVWAWEWGDPGALTRLDPQMNDEGSYEGSGPVYEIGDECWRILEDDEGGNVGVERVWPGPPIQTMSRAAPALQYDGNAFWRRPYGLIQAWSPRTGESDGTTYVIDKADISSYWKLGDDGIVVAAAGSLWLINGWEIVGFDIPAG